ncbi:DUF4817 domain-containing protein [Trichonephila clavipes]|nr:DUF4817 domain-containing protein [Trichonephila clavipes]
MHGLLPKDTSKVSLILRIPSSTTVLKNCNTLKESSEINKVCYDWIMEVSVNDALYRRMEEMSEISILFRYQFGLATHQNDHQARRRFVKWAQKEIAVVPDFHKRILSSDEAHFWLNGYVNKRNCRIWSEANPQVYVETPLHPETLTVWCALWAGGIIGPYFFKNDEGHNVTVKALATIDLLKDTFGDHLISRFGPVNWPPRSWDLTPLDYFLWGYVKSLVYADKPQTLDHLEDNIRRVIADIRPQMLEKVIENWTSRLDYIRASRGSPMSENIIIIHPLALSSRNQDSSLYVTRFKSSTFQSLCSLAHARPAARQRALSNGTLVGRWLSKPIR